MGDGRGDEKTGRDRLSGGPPKWHNAKDDGADAQGAAISASGNLTIRTSHGALIIGPTTGFPNLVQGAAGGAGSMPGLAALRQAPEGFDAIRRWPRRFDLMPGASTASDGQIVNALERGIAEHRVVLLYVADSPAPSSHAVAKAAAAPAAKAAPGLMTVSSQPGDAAIRGMSGTDRVLEALAKGLRQLGPEFRDIVEQFLEPENLLKTAGFLVAAAAVGLAAHTNPITAVVFDGAMIAFVYYSAGRAGVEALVVLYSATARASNASTTADIDSAARDYARAIIGLGGAVFLGWLARHLRFRAWSRVQRPEAPAAPLPPATRVPRGGTPPPEPAMSPFTQRYLTESGGRFGSSATRRQNYDLARGLQRDGFEITGGGGMRSEEFIRGIGPGTRGSTFVDITARAADGRVVRIQTIDTMLDGITPTAREAAAAARIRAAFPNDILRLVPKGP